MVSPRSRLSQPAAFAATMSMLAFLLLSSCSDDAGKSQGPSEPQPTRLSTSSSSAVPSSPTSPAGPHVRLREVVGSWRPTLVFGNPITRADQRKGALQISSKGVIATVFGCRSLHGPLNLQPDGTIDPTIQKDPTGCPVWTGRDGLGPNTPRVLRTAQSVAVEDHTLRFADAAGNAIAEYRSVR